MFRSFAGLGILPVGKVAYNTPMVSVVIGNRNRQRCTFAVMVMFGNLFTVVEE